MTRDESKMYDVRTLERNIRKGIITRKDYEKYLKTLVDKADNVAISRPDDSVDAFDAAIGAAEGG